MSENIESGSTPSRRSALRLGAATAATAAAAVGLSALGTPSALAAASSGPQPGLNGQRVKVPGNGAVFLIMDGYRRWIPNPATYDSLFRNWSGIVSDTGVINIPEGTALTSGATLGRAQGGTAVYLFSNGTKRWVTSPAAMDKYYFNWNRVVTLPAVTVDSVPTGASLS